MNLLIPSLVALAPIATAASQLGLIAEIEASYKPKIEFRQTGFDLSLYGCPIEEFQIMGQDPVSQNQRAVSLSLYRPRGWHEGQGTVIILPPTGGVNVLDRGYANELCSSGLTVALISGWEHQSDISLDFKMHDEGALRALAATRHVVELLQSENQGPIGLLGTSIGAIAGSLVLGFEPRINSAVLIVGSARFADVIAHSDEAGAASLRRKRMQAMDIKSLDDYSSAVREAVRIEPSEFIGNAGMKRAMVITADADTTVPTEYQLELVELLKAESHIHLRGNHLQVIKDTFWGHRSAISKFFLAALGGA